MNFKIHFQNDQVRELYQTAGVQTTHSAGFDLVCSRDVKFQTNGEFQLIPLGVVIEVPEGHHSLLMPRSSTFKKFKIIQANGVGLIDHDYCGPEDYWFMPAVYLGSDKQEIKAGTRICQFILQKTIQIDEFSEFDPTRESRGGLGSTGV